MAQPSSKTYDTRLVKEVIRKTRKDLAESFRPEAVLDQMAQDGVINMAQLDRLETYLKNEGRIYATDQILSMVMKDEIQADGFMAALRKQIPWAEERIEADVKKFQTGEWKLYGEANVEGNCYWFSHYPAERTNFKGLGNT